MSPIKKSIVCFGLTPCIQRILEFPSVEKGRVNRAVKTTVGIGGKGANTARMIKQLGGISLLFGFAGGANGRLLEQMLDAEDINYRHVHVSGETRICQTLVEAGNPETTELVEEMPPVDSGEWDRLLQGVDALNLSGAIAALSGKLPAGAPEDGYAQLCRLVAGQGGRVILDAPGQPLMLALEHKPALVKINDAELLQTTGMYHVEIAAQSLLDKGAKSVLITSGAKQAYYVDAEQTLNIFPPKIEAVNPVGSGDAVTAGMAFALNRGKSIEEAIIEGMACGAANALNLLSGFIRLEDVERLRNEVVLKPLGK